MEQAVAGPATVPPGATTITGKSGTVYRKAESLSFKRYDWRAACCLRAFYGREPDKMFADWKTVYSHLNSRDKLADASVIAYNNLKGVADIREDRINPLMELALLFWNAEGEDVGTMSEEVMEKKRRDLEHYDAQFFFDQAVSCMPGFSAAYNEGSRLTSQVKGTKEEK